MDAWLIAARDAAARVAGVDAGDLELSDDDVRQLLEVARLAAHESGDRRNAPLLCYLIGRASASASLDEVAAAVRRESA